MTAHKHPAAMAPLDVLLEVREWNREMRRKAVRDDRDNDADRYAANIRFVEHYIDFGEAA